jgi:hypothetical protein
VTIFGEGSAVVSWDAADDFSVVVSLDCSGCTGRVVLMADRKGTPLAQGDAPYQATVLPPSEVSAANSVLLDATGSWAMTLLDWNYLPVVSGPQSGTGSSVIYLNTPATHASIDVRDVAHGEAIWLRSYPDKSTNGDSRAQIWYAPGTQVVEADLPGVIAIVTTGTWTITPQP